MSYQEYDQLVGFDSVSADKACKDLFDPTESARRIRLAAEADRARRRAAFEKIHKTRPRKLPTLNTRDYDEYEDDDHVEDCEDDEPKTTMNHEDARCDRVALKNQDEVMDEDLARAIEESLKLHAQSNVLLASVIEQVTGSLKTQPKDDECLISDGEDEFELVQNSTDDVVSLPASQDDHSKTGDDWSVLDSDETASEWTMPEHGTFKQALLENQITSTVVTTIRPPSSAAIYSTLANFVTEEKKKNRTKKAQEEDSFDYQGGDYEASKLEGQTNYGRNMRGSRRRRG